MGLLPILSPVLKVGLYGGGVVGIPVFGIKPGYGLFLEGFLAPLYLSAIKPATTGAPTTTALAS